MAEPITRKEQFLNAIALNDPTLLPVAITREERFLRALSTGDTTDLPVPITFEEEFLNSAIAFLGSGGGVTEPPVAGNLFDGIYMATGNYLNGTSIAILSGGGATTRLAVISVEANTSYDIAKGVSNRFVVGYTSSAPIFDGTGALISGAIDYNTNPPHPTALITPVNATHMLIYVSTDSVEPTLTITITNP